MRRKGGLLMLVGVRGALRACRQLRVEQQLPEGRYRCRGCGGCACSCLGDLQGSDKWPAMLFAIVCACVANCNGTPSSTCQRPLLVRCKALAARLAPSSAVLGLRLGEALTCRRFAKQASTAAAACLSGGCFRGYKAVRGLLPRACTAAGAWGSQVERRCTCCRADGSSQRE